MDGERVIRRKIHWVTCDCGVRIPSDGIFLHRRMARQHGGVAQRSRASAPKPKDVGLDSHRPLLRKSK